jgi:Tol biopolymer transport system component
VRPSSSRFPLALCSAALGLALLSAASGDALSASDPPKSGYLSQREPGSAPELFAPGMISTGLNERDAAFTPDGDDFYYSLWLSSRRGVIMVVNRRRGSWGKPAVAPFSGVWSDIEPCLSPDGKRLFFASNRPLEASGKAKDYDIWVMERTGGNWGEPRNLGSPVNAEGDEFYPSVTRDGTLYFTAARKGGLGGEDIYRAKLGDGVYLPPENCGPSVNGPRGEFNAFVAPDESYLLFSSFGRPDDLGGGDLYICFKGEDGGWTPASHLKAPLNSDRLDYCPSVSPDGRFLFFTSDRLAPGLAPGQRLTAAIIEAMEARPGNGRGDLYWVSIRALDPYGPAPKAD